MPPLSLPMPPETPPEPMLDPDLALSARYRVRDLMRSDTAEREGIDNTPSHAVLDNLCRLADGLEAIGRLLGHPLVISSAYRCDALNRRVGGTPNSQHAQGLAADFTCPGHGDPMGIAQCLESSDLVFDQCILEFGRWVHVSFSATPRRRVLTIRSSDEGYLDGLHPMPSDTRISRCE